MVYDNDFVRHKMLDFIGDFALLNKYFNCKIQIFNPSHYTNYEFVKYLKKTLNEINKQ
jgi:UDP-3-O-acyl-N-acetylglucosamine deacetylase